MLSNDVFPHCPSFRVQLLSGNMNNLTFGVLRMKCWKWSYFHLDPGESVLWEFCFHTYFVAVGCIPALLSIPLFRWSFLKPFQSRTHLSPRQFHRLCWTALHPGDWSPSFPAPLLVCNHTQNHPFLLLLMSASTANYPLSYLSSLKIFKCMVEQVQNFLNLFFFSISLHVEGD